VDQDSSTPQGFSPTIVDSKEDPPTPADDDASTTDAKKRLNPKVRPTKSLPTNRIGFTKQLDLLRAYVAASGPSGKVVNYREVAEMLDMHQQTPQLATSFFVDVALLQKHGTQGFLPSPVTLEYARAFQWNPATAAHKLGATLAVTWFAQAIMPTLSFRPTMETTEAINKLADACAAGPEYQPQLALLLDFLAASGLIVKDGSLIRRAETTAEAAPSVPAPATPKIESTTMTPPVLQTQPSSTASTFAAAKSGVRFTVDVDVDMDEMASWAPDRITAFFSGIAAVLAAKGGLESRAASHPKQGGESG
jgi:hypothetical protein